MQARTSLMPSLIVSLLCGMLPIACKSTEGHDRAAHTADQVVKVGGVAGQTQTYLDKTLASLEQVVATKDQDPKPAFDTFVKQLGGFQSEFAKLTKARDAMKAKSTEWFAEFEAKNAAIQDPELREDGTKRLASFRDQVMEVSEQVDGLMTETNALQVTLTDLRTYLGNDLTPNGIDAVSGRIGNTAKSGRKLADGLGRLSKSSDTLAAGLRAARQPVQ